MKEIFVGVIYDKYGNIEQSFVTENSDDGFYVEIFDENSNPVILGEFRKWHHVEKVIKESKGRYTCVSYNKSIPIDELLKFVSKF